MNAQSDLQLQHHVQVRMRRDRVDGRRDFLRYVSAASLAAGSLGFTDLLSLQAAALRRREMSCILLWMQGGPSQFETFSPKPGHANGGETRAIGTSVAGIELSENFPRVAQQMRDVAIVRSMTSKEGSHRRASYLLHTGQLPTPTVKYPTLGSMVASEYGRGGSELPSFVQIGGRGLPVARAGYLGAQFDPFQHPRADQPPQNSRPTSAEQRYRRRLGLLDNLEEGFAARGGRRAVEQHRKLYNQASRMVLSPRMRAFDLEQEPDAMREAYGKHQFGAGCLLARRLIEEGVTFVEVVAGNWDTHFDNFDRSRQLAEQVDRPMAQLLADLRQRGRLERTMVIWMGEFGRTPRINPRSGRDHYPKAFNAALAGGGIQGGRVIGKTDAGGETVTDRPVHVADLFRSICHGLAIDPDREHTSAIGRPIKLVEGGEVVQELFS